MCSQGSGERGAARSIAWWIVLSGQIRKSAPLAWSFANPAGPVTPEAFERIAGIMTSALSDALDAGPIDGVFLELHGAMVAVDFPDAEAEVLALITQGKSNAEVAKLTCLSPNTVKSYIRSIYRKIDAGSRTQAVLWGVRNGFTPDHHRIDHWKGGP